MSDDTSITQIAIDVSIIDPFTPAADAAKAVCALNGQDPYGHRQVSGINMSAWQAVIFQARVFSILGVI